MTPESISPDVPETLVATLELTSLAVWETTAARLGRLESATQVLTNPEGSETDKAKSRAVNVN
jgi:hypothetical protein